MTYPTSNWTFYSHPSASCNTMQSVCCIGVLTYTLALGITGYHPQYLCDYSYFPFTSEYIFLTNNDNAVYLNFVFVCMPLILRCKQMVEKYLYSTFSKTNLQSVIQILLSVVGSTLSVISMISSSNFCIYK